MSGKTPKNLQTVQDPEVLAWLSGDSSEARELIVEARLPKRQVAMRKGADGRVVPHNITSDAATERAETLADLHAWLTERLDVPPVMLKAAGAIAVQATSQQVRQFADHPLVKSIRPNRQLKRR